jgi:hypothetical protein
LTRYLPLAALAGLGLLALAPATGKPAATPDRQIRATIERLYAVYRRDAAAPGYSETMTPFTARTRRLIGQWRAHLPPDEVTDMGDFDWFCQCQDWDAKAFAVTRIGLRKAGPRAYDAAVSYALDRDTKRSLRLVMMFEDSGWKVDDMIFGDGPPRALRASLVAEMRQYGGRPQ